MTKKVNHQFSLFGYVKPKAKVPISSERLKEAKKKYEEGDKKGSAAILRELREGLESFYERKFGKK